MALKLRDVSTLIQWFVRAVLISNSLLNFCVCRFAATAVHCLRWTFRAGEPLHQLVKRNYRVSLFQRHRGTQEILLWYFCRSVQDHWLVALRCCVSGEYFRSWVDVMSLVCREMAAMLFIKFSFWNPEWGTTMLQSVKARYVREEYSVQEQVRSVNSPRCYLLVSVQSYYDEGCLRPWDSYVRTRE